MNYAAMRYLTEGGCPVEGAAWQVCAVIAWHADKTTGDSYLSRRRLAQEARLSTGTVHAVLLDLVDRGILEIVIAGTGRRAMTYRIRVPCVTSVTTASGSTTEPQPQVVVAQSTDRSGSVTQPVVAQLAGPYIGGREEQEGFEGRASAAPPTGGASRSTNPADSEVDKDWRSALGLPTRPVPAHPGPHPGPQHPAVGNGTVTDNGTTRDGTTGPPRKRRRPPRTRRGREPPNLRHGLAREQLMTLETA